MQKYSAVAVGTLFWMTIILVANYAGLQELRTKYTFKTLNCGRNFKQCLLEYPYNECYSAFSICMQDNMDFVFPAKMEVIEKKVEITTDVFTEKEQEINLKRCKRLNFYGKQIQIRLHNILKIYEYAKISAQKRTKTTELSALICAGN